MSRLLKPTNLLRNIWLVVCLLPGILSLPLTAAEPSVKTPSTSHRWLLVVDTSRAMERRSEAVQQIASNLVVSAMNGQAQPGDTLGVWTFNEELQTGRFPLQTFTSNNIPAARRLAGFLRAQPHEGSGRLPNVMPTLMHLVQSSDFITVIILSDGSSEIVGTPFDEKINASFRSWRREQARGQMPFVTLLRASLGNVTQYAVSTPPFPLEMPPLQEALVQARNEAVRAVEPVKAQPRPTPPPLIVSGRKPSTNVTQAVPQPDPQPLKVVESTPTNSLPERPAVAAAPAPSAQTSAVAAAETQPKPVEPTPPSEQTVETSPGVTPVAARASAPQPGANAGPAPSAGRMNNAVLAGIVLTVALSGVVLILLMRGRHSRKHASLITRSLENRRQ